MNYWPSIAQRTWSLFKATGKELKFVWGLVLIVLAAAAALLGTDWSGRLDQALKLWWVPVLSVALLAVYSFLRATERHAADLEGRFQHQTDEQRVEAERKRDIAQGLRRYRSDGVTLLNDFERTFVIPSDPIRFNTWHHNAGLFIQQALRERYDDWRMPVIQNSPFAHMDERIRTINQTRVLLERLVQLISDLEQP
jgi:hypothetical protein